MHYIFYVHRFYMQNITVCTIDVLESVFTLKLVSELPRRYARVGHRVYPNVVWVYSI